MRMLMLTVVVVPALARVALADGYPDLHGTWQGYVETVLVDTEQFNERGGDATIFGGFPVALVVTRQEGRRFAGSVEVDGAINPIAGVLTTESTIQWAGREGRVEGRLLDPDTIDHCYIRPGASRQIAACGVFRRTAR